MKKLKGYWNKIPHIQLFNFNMIKLSNLPQYELFKHRNTSQTPEKCCVMLIPRNYS